jgi:NAD(P)-dependent dehydrogenase (short-subunit alcohol dehydrogenase family)
VTGVMGKRFEGRVAIVTGAARGIGLAVAERLGREGARVVLLDMLADLGHETEKRLRDEGLDATFVPVDITDRTQIDETADRAVREFGSIDVLVNNAALVKETPLFEATEREFTDILAVNVTGMFSVTQAVAERMVQAGRGGSIVNMSSITAVHGAPNLLAYSASKGAISAMTRSMAIALAQHDIRVNAVAPGAIATENFVKFYDNDAVMRRNILSRTPLRRLGEPAEAAATVAFLASDDAGYITGQVVYPDGGRLALGYTVPVDD